MNKKIIIALSVFATLSISVFAQTEKIDSLETATEAAPDTKAQYDDEMRTLFSDKDGKTTHGIYGAMTFGYTQLDNNDALISGGRVGWVINHGIVLGMHGYGFVNNLGREGTPGISDYSLAGGYGGLYIEPIIAPKFPVHLTFPMQLGIGGITASEGYGWDDTYNDSYYDTDLLLVAEPAAELELNLVKFLRLSFGVSYRFTNNVDLAYKYYDGTDFTTEYISSDVLEGFTYNVSLKLGWF